MKGLVGVVAAVALMSATAFAEFSPSGGQVRISNAGPDGNDDFFSAAPELAFNPTRGEYLVVWDDDGDNDEEFEISGQRVSASGAEVGGDIPIASISDETGEGFDAAVAYNPEDDEYLVVMSADNLALDGEYEIWGQRVDGDGTPLGGTFRISNVGTDGNAEAEVYFPDVAYSPAADAYMVIWEGENAGENDFEIYGQRVARGGAQIGVDFQISNVGAGGVRGAFTPALTFNPATGEFLAVWEGEGTPVDEAYEIYGQRLDGAGVEQGGDFQISSMDTPEMPDGFSAALTANPATGEMLVVWQSGDPSLDDVEVFGQLLGPNGAEIGKDFRISNALDVDESHDAGQAGVAFSPKSNEYVVTWLSDANPTEEIEVYGQRLGPGGGELGADFQISDVAAAGADRNVDEEDPSSIAHDSVNDRFLSVYSADALATDDEFEIFGRLLAPSVPGQPLTPPRPAPPIGVGPTAPPSLKCKGKLATKSGTSGRDVLRGTPKADVIAGGGGNDKLIGLAGKDLLCGGQGKDTLKGGGGKDRLFGEGGKDVLSGGPEKDVVNGGPGKDTQAQ